MRGKQMLEGDAEGVMDTDNHRLGEGAPTAEDG